MVGVMDTEKQPLVQPQDELEEQQLSLDELQQNVFKAQRAYVRAWSRSTSGKWHKRIVFAVTALLLLFVALFVGVIVQDAIDGDDTWAVPHRIPLEAHIMSKCPDAKDCLHDMILPAMQNVSDKVDFRLSYIGEVTYQDDGVLCKHGQEECLGNIIELCAAHLYPDPKIYLGFTMCMTRQYQDIPKRTLVEDCALEHGISMEDLNDCTDDNGSLSVKKLQSSFNHSAKAGVTKSCTVRINGKIRCIRDGGEWKDCDGGSKAQDLVRDVLDQYQSQWNRS